MSPAERAELQAEVLDGDRDREAAPTSGPAAPLRVRWGSRRVRGNPGPGDRRRRRGRDDRGPGEAGPRGHAGRGPGGDHSPGVAVPRPGVEGFLSLGVQRRGGGPAAGPDADRGRRVGRGPGITNPGAAFTAHIKRCRAAAETRWSGGTPHDVVGVSTRLRTSSVSVIAPRLNSLMSRRVTIDLLGNDRRGASPSSLRLQRRFPCGSRSHDGLDCLSGVGDDPQRLTW